MGSGARNELQLSLVASLFGDGLSYQESGGDGLSDPESGELQSFSIQRAPSTDLGLTSGLSSLSVDGLSYQEPGEPQ